MAVKSLKVLKVIKKNILCQFVIQIIGAVI